MASSRPKSMSDFAALLDASTPLGSKKDERPRKKPSISLATGLIMASDSPRSVPNTPQHAQAHGGELSGNLFYAYAQKSDYAPSLPYILTFVSATVADQWWALVQREYPDSTRPGPQLFVLKDDDLQEQIQDNPRFYDLRNKWWYTSSEGSTGVIPLQDWKGHPVTAPPPAPAPKEEREEVFDMAKLSATLDKMNAMVTENSAQIRALAVAQGQGLSRMQDINESNSTQIKALADSQIQLQAVVDQNASHYIALSNTSFSNQEQVKSVLKGSSEQIKSLADSQVKLAKTCDGMIRTISDLGYTVGRVSDNIGRVSDNISLMSMSDTRSRSSSISDGIPFGAIASRMSPPPRKLNRKIKGIWYEYDDGSVGGGRAPVTIPKKSVAFCDTPPKSPLSGKIK